MKKPIKLLTLTLSLSLLLSACSLLGKEDNNKKEEKNKQIAQVKDNEEKPAEKKPIVEGKEKSTEEEHERPVVKVKPAKQEEEKVPEKPEEEKPAEEVKPEVSKKPTEKETPVEKKPEPPTSKPAPKAPVITTKDITKKETISFKTMRISNSSIEKGKEQVSTEGRNGEKTLTYRVTYKDGKEVSRKLISSKVNVKPQNKIVLVGTKTIEKPAPKPSEKPAPKAPVITTKDITKKETISFKTIRKKSSSLEKGKEKVSTEGRNGEKTLTYRVTYKDGKEASRKLVSSKVNVNPQNKIVLVGTKSIEKQTPASKVKPQRPKATPKPKTKPASKKKYRRIGNDKVQIHDTDGMNRIYFIGPGNSGRWFRNEKECLNFGHTEGFKRLDKGLSGRFSYGREYDLKTQTVRWTVDWEKENQTLEDMLKN